VDLYGSVHAAQLYTSVAGADGGLGRARNGDLIIDPRAAPEEHELGARKLRRANVDGLAAGGDAAFDARGVVVAAAVEAAKISATTLIVTSGLSWTRTRMRPLRLSMRSFARSPVWIVRVKERR